MRINTIKKIKGGYEVVSEKTGKSLGGTKDHPLSKEGAKERLREVEAFKHMKGGK